METTVISGQRYLDDKIVEAKIAELQGLEAVCIPVTSGEIDGVKYSIIRDGHHRLAAARVLGLAVEFAEVALNDDPRGIDFAEFIVDHCYADSDFYDIHTGVNVW